MTLFTIIVLSLAVALLVTGAILLKKNLKPILGFFLLIFALALFIGITMDPSGLFKEVTGIVSLLK